MKKENEARSHTRNLPCRSRIFFHVGNQLVNVVHFHLRSLPELAVAVLVDLVLNIEVVLSAIPTLGNICQKGRVCAGGRPCGIRSAHSTRKVNLGKHILDCLLVVVHVRLLG